MTMSPCNSPANYQGLVNNVFHDYVDRFLVVYIGDILFHGTGQEGHAQHIRAVLDRLKNHKLYQSSNKCELLKTEALFLRLIVSCDGIRVICNLSRFIPSISTRTAPLTRFTQKWSCIRDWDVITVAAFCNLKSTLVNTPVFIPTTWTKPLPGHIDTF